MVIAALGVAFSALVARHLLLQQDDPRPNLVLIVVDDMRHDALGTLNPALSTPNLDRMAREGVRFTNAFVTTSLCSPSRATILTSRSMRNHRVFSNLRDEPEGTVFFPAYLQPAGYRTAMIGKWHMGSGDAPRPGFDHWVSFSGQGVYLPEQEPGGKMLNVNGEHVPQQGYITDELTDHAIDWLSAGRESTQPFFLYLAHKAVHAPFTPAARHRGRYKDLVITPPPTAADRPENYLDKPRWVRTQRNSWHGVDYAYYVYLGMPGLMDFQRLYYETLLAVDDSVGRILDYLHAEGLERDTIVLLTSDNGFLFGEHGLIDKRNAYEPSIRVPLLAWAPGRIDHQVVDGLVQSLDIAPTVLELAGVPRPDDLEGRSFAALATGTIARADWKRELIYEYYWEWAFPQTPTTFAIRNDAYKYIYYHGVWEPEELYDLSADPGETRNLALDPAHAAMLGTLRERLFEAVRDKDGRRVIPFDEKNGVERVYRNGSGPGPGDFPLDWLRGPGGHR